MHRRLISLARDTRGIFAFTVGSIWLAGVLTIGQAWLLSKIVDAAFLKNATLSQALHLLEWLLALMLLRAALVGLHEIGAKEIAVRVKSELRRKIFAHLQALGPLYTRGERTGELTNTAVEGIEALDAYFSQYLPQVVVTALIPLTILAVVFPKDTLSGVVMLLTAPMIPFFMVLIGKGAEEVTRRQYLTLSRLSAHFLDTLQGLTTLKLLGRSKDYADTIAEASEQYRRATLNVLKITFLSAFALELLATISTAIVAVEVGLRLLYAKMAFQGAFFVLILAPEFYLPFRLLGLRFHAGMDGVTAAERIFEILDARPLRPTDRPTPPDAPIAAVELVGVSFTYPGGKKPALRNINLRINAGERVALVGASGAGKSTLAGLLLGFLAPTEGKIRTVFADGTVLESPPPPQSLAWVPQQPHLFHGTLEENLRLGNPDASEEEIFRALQNANLTNFVQSLPNGLKTDVGAMGARLSGGQAQRVALARAFLKNAPWLILDEPTSHLDPETEAQLEASTRSLMQGRTVLVIAHRLHTVQDSSRIVVLSEGEIVEQGTHAELLKRGGVYAQMLSAPESGAAEATPAREAPKPKGLPRLRPAAAVPSAEDFAPSPKAKGIFLRLVGFLSGSERWVALSVLLGALTIGSNVSLMGTSAWLISTAALHPDIGSLQVAIVGVRFFGISRAVFRYFERLVSHNVTLRLLARLRVWFYERIEPLAPARLISYSAGDLLARIVGDIETLENLYVRVLAPMLVAVVTILGVGLFLAWYGISFALVAIGAFVAAAALLPLVVRRLSREPGREMVTLRGKLSALIVDGIQGLADLLAYDRAAEHGERIARVDEEYAKAQKRLALLSAVHTGLSGLFADLALWGVVALSIPMVRAGHLEGVMIGTLGLLTLAAFEAANPLPAAAQMWESVRTAGGRLFEVVDAPPAVPETPQLTAQAVPQKPRDFSVEVAHLTFAYPENEEPVLRDVSFTVPQGKILAIVGPSGAGKSTIANLLLRFWDYEHGEIRLGGANIKAMPPDEVRRYFAVVSQHTYLFNMTVRENLLLANPEATEEEIVEAARRAQIHDVIMSLPQGYDTYIGEQGARLSGGERQRLAVARALLKGSPILLLDEPTAHLDAITEREVLRALFAATEGRTTIWITHRLLEMERMDEILVLSKGEIVERGTHTELIARGGLYRRMWELQHGEILG